MREGKLRDLRAENETEKEDVTSNTGEETISKAEMNRVSGPSTARQEDNTASEGLLGTCMHDSTPAAVVAVVDLLADRVVHVVVWFQELACDTLA